MSNNCLENSSKNLNACRHTAFEILFPGHMQILPCVDTISGKGEPCAIIKVRVDSLPMQKTKVAPNGRWCIPLECPLSPGHHVIFAASSQAGEPTEKACIIVASPTNFPPCDCHCRCSCHCNNQNSVNPFRQTNMAVEQTLKEDAKYNVEHEQRPFEAQNAGTELPPSPEILVTPEILYPKHEQEIFEKLPLVRGKAIPNNMVIVCIRGMMCSRTTADENGDFSVTFPRELTKGNYTVTALQADSKGNRSKLVDHSFTVSI